MGGLTEEQLYSIAVTERIVSFFSISGTLFIITTFLSSSMFDKAINRLVFYAAWGNLLANVATLISINGIDAGPHSALCQFQGFLVQIIKAMEWKYGLFCYGMPFVLAFTYLFIETQARGKIYGPAILWCWVSIKWDPLRIGLFYGPVWLVTAATSAVYLRVGRDIFMKREQLAMFPITAPVSPPASPTTFSPSIFTVITPPARARINLLRAPLL
ncbi:MAG: hypothetical protein M1827_001017 [Pycnora praestabilis]|nr:MAG: hypothetical protein M1827_001017 [Pycnora praestabilis]